MLSAVFAILYSVSWPNLHFWQSIDKEIYLSLSSLVSTNGFFGISLAMLSQPSFDVVAVVVSLFIFWGYIKEDACDLEVAIKRFLSLKISVFFALILLQEIHILFDLLKIKETSPLASGLNANLGAESLGWIETKPYKEGGFPIFANVVCLSLACTAYSFIGKKQGAVIFAFPALLSVVGLASGFYWFSEILAVFAVVIATQYFLIYQFGVYKISRDKLYEILKGSRTIAYATKIMAEKNSQKRFVKGSAVGAVDIIPGISGSTMAIALDIYDNLIKAINSCSKALFLFLKGEIKASFKEVDWNFLLPFAVGVVFGMFLIVKFARLPELVNIIPEYIYSIFFGLILGSIIFLLKDNKIKNLSSILVIAFGALASFLLTILVPTQTPDELWFIFLCGFLASSAMLVPGISGSLLLLMLGKYSYILSEIGQLNIHVITAFASGLLIGLLSFAKILHMLLQKHHSFMMHLIIGLLIGSLYKIWPFKENIIKNGDLVKQTVIMPTIVNSQFAICTILFCLSLFLILYLHVKEKNKQI